MIGDLNSGKMFFVAFNFTGKPQELLRLRINWYSFAHVQFSNI